MKNLFHTIFLAAVLACVILLVISRPAPATAAARRSVVVELFTSEGCSSCPPADALLSQLRNQGMEKGVEVIPLGFHVDYWNYQGWQDRFSSPDYSKRQETYAEQLHTEGPYTPEMVVNGSQEFVGNDATRARSTIADEAAEAATGQVSLKPEAGKLVINVSSQPETSGEVWLAITEDNLSSSVAAGENAGRKLHHDAVVREFKNIGQLQGGKFARTLPLALKRDWKSGDLRVAVFVQDRRTGKIEGAAEISATDISK